MPAGPSVGAEIRRSKRRSDLKKLNLKGQIFIKIKVAFFILINLKTCEVDLIAQIFIKMSFYKN